MSRQPQNQTGAYQIEYEFPFRIIDGSLPRLDRGGVAFEIGVRLTGNAWSVPEWTSSFVPERKLLYGPTEKTTRFPPLCI